MQQSDPTAGASRDVPTASDPLLEQTNKRLTLNLLIQGAAAHTLLTAHHLVKDELEAIRPGLTRLYDRMAVSAHLAYWFSDVPLLSGPSFYGLPSWFWKASRRTGHPFHRHQLLATHGGELARASKRYLLARGWKKWVIGIPVLHYVQMLWLLLRVALAESGRKPQLAELAKRATARVWGIEESRLVAVFTTEVAFGHLKPAKTLAGRLTQLGAAGFGGVERRGGQFQVIAKSWNWPLVAHELVKGTAELICLHGLNTLDDATYEAVTDEADQIEYECWLLQAGPEMWRLLLSVLPHDRPLAEVLMHIARLDPEPLEQLMLAVIEDPARAKRLLEQLG
jgi:hypothetical protein